MGFAGMKNTYKETPKGTNLENMAKEGLEKINGLGPTAQNIQKTLQSMPMYKMTVLLVITPKSST